MRSFLEALGLLDRVEWYVVYPEGEKSVLMTATQARDMAHIFGGTIHRFGEAKKDGE